MPFVRIDLVAGKTPEYRKTIGDVVQDARLATIDVPNDDRFQVITEHPADDLIADPTCFGYAV